ncbi:hypothetical protein B0H19DRAFT_1266715 [Mycena capillaripes]|nr:hypothetical protein B0H19DRAFT_1266713 [Mycena capillaripes]KAJ6545254.1 hypothetical protein B0H19DRAFT_1266715 [Mycena capillaripes]
MAGNAHQNQKKQQNHRDCPGSSQKSPIGTGRRRGGNGRAAKKNHAPQAAQNTADDEVERLCERASQLEQLCQSNGISVSNAVNGVADRSIPRPRNSKKDTNIADIREHMGIGGTANKRVWLNCRKSVRNNLTLAHCLQTIEHECPLFKRFKASWGAASRNTAVDSASRDDVDSNAGDSDTAEGQHTKEKCDEDSEGDDEQPRAAATSHRKRPHALSPTPSDDDETNIPAPLPPAKK